ncbi:l1 transposable element-related [Holotrichia oblita]|uniref:L1 transposable element-related n=1 Tax=Holotrichia oblita TaxID=644536 RepID=A0ACB9SL66_HOLOL|nr:l1 transposable element-related [Holotrichia oblita]
MQVPETQADEMLQKSNKTFPPVSSGVTVLVKIPDVDRGRAAPRNVMAIIMEWKEESDLYQLGTTSGVPEKLYARNEFQVADHKSYQNLQAAIDDITENEKDIDIVIIPPSRQLIGPIPSCGTTNREIAKTMEKWSANEDDIDEDDTQADTLPFDVPGAVEIFFQNSTESDPEDNIPLIMLRSISNTGELATKKEKIAEKNQIGLTK